MRIFNNRIGKAQSNAKGEVLQEAEKPSDISPLSLEDKIYEALFRETGLRSNTFTTVDYISGVVGGDVKEVKEILENVDWAEEQYHKFRFVGKASEERKQELEKEKENKEEIILDLKAIPSLDDTVPISLSYFDEITEIIDDWKKLYKKVLVALFEDYPDVFEKISEDNGDLTLAIAKGKNTISFRKPFFIGSNIFAEVDASATDIANQIRKLLKLCNMDYDNLKIVYKKNSEGIEKPKTYEPYSNDTGRTIVEAAEIVLKEVNTPLTVEEIYNEIIKQDLYHFGAADPVGVLSISLMRATEGSGYHRQPNGKDLFKLIKDADGIKRFSLLVSSASNSNTQNSDKHSEQEIIEEKLALKSPLLYRRLEQVSKIYTEPQGIKINLIRSLIHNVASESVIKDFLDAVPWAVNLGNDIYSFNGDAIANPEKYKNLPKPIVIERPIVKNKSKYEQVLMQRFKNGMKFDSIDFDNFRETYEAIFNRSLTEDDDSLEEQLSQCGVVYKERLYPAEGIIGVAAKDKLFEYIENNFALGKKVIYYKALFEELSDVFASCFALSDSEMLREYLKYVSEPDRYFFYKDYMSNENNVVVDNTAEVEELFLNAGKPISVEEACLSLSHIPQAQIDRIIKTDKRFLRNAKGEYYHIGIFEMTHEESDYISDIINGLINDNKYAIWTDVWNRIVEEMPEFIENNSYLSPLGIRNAVEVFLSHKFSFNSAVISSIYEEFDMSDVFRYYATKRSSFSADEIYQFAKELDTVIYFYALQDVSIRVNHDLFISKAQLNFDVAAIDTAIASYMSKDYIKIREIDSFLTFPNVGYEWNEYLLEGFVWSFSKEFMLLNNGFALNNVAGVIVRRNGKIKEFVDACAVILADAPIELNEKDSLDYLVSVNMITRRSYRQIEEALNKAKQIRLGRS